MNSLLRGLRLDPYILAIIGMVVLAAVLPARGVEKHMHDYVMVAAIAILFFLYGARNTPQVIWAGITHWRLQSLPLVLFHQMQPMVWAALARRYGQRPSSELKVIFLNAAGSTER